MLKWKNLSQPFNISFGFPIQHSTETIQISALAQCHHSIPYYIIDSFYFDGNEQNQNAVSLLPPVVIQQVKKEGKSVWVHKDSGRESQLSLAIGKAIEKSGHLEL